MKLLARVVGGLDRLSGGRTTRYALDRVLRPYGRIEDLAIDRRARTLAAVVRLHGEQRALRVEVDRYRLDALRGTLTLEGVRTDRAWATEVAVRFVERRPLALPPEAALVLSELL